MAKGCGVSSLTPMNLIGWLIAVAVMFFLVERMWPAAALPKVRGWWARIALVNLAQLGVVLLAGRLWDRWFARASLFRPGDLAGDVGAALVAYLVSCFVFYAWHRIRHESDLFWRLCHQFHHSPRRIELLTSFYKHPVEILINSMLTSALVFGMLGCSLRSAAIYTFLIAVAEYFYHWNVRTPRWLGWIIQRPEAHRVHHEYRRHTRNYADLPFIDRLFGTLENPTREVRRCGFNPRAEARVIDMLAFRDVQKPAAEKALSPTCFGCRKRWLCQAAKEENSRETQD
jgi:sterol desaturase/sphingolipid hydroxylase (fatty acid hydroxylase superfamily)